MWPTLRHGDILLVDRHGSPRLNDVVAVRAMGDKLVAHRLVAMVNGRLRCANARGECDPWVDAACLFGRVVAVERDGELIGVGDEPKGVRFLWFLRSAYGAIRRVRSRLQRSLG